MSLSDWLYRPFLALFARRILADAEVQTAIRCSESLQAAYARADQLEAEGYTNLAQELRAKADSIDLDQPGRKSLDYIESLSQQPARIGTGPISPPNGAPALAGEPAKKKRGPGRPRKSEQQESN